MRSIKGEMKEKNMMNLQNSEVSLAPKVSQQSDFHKAFDYAKLDPVTIKNLLRMDFLVQIQARMKESGVSNLEMAERIGADEEVLHCIFSGEIPLKLDLMVMLALAVKCRLRIYLEPEQ